MFLICDNGQFVFVQELWPRIFVPEWVDSQKRLGHFEVEQSPVTTARICRETAQISTWITTDLSGVSLVALNNLVSLLSATEVCDTFDIRRVLVSGQWMSPSAVRVVSEKLHGGARLGMAVYMESVLAVSLDKAVFAVASLIATRVHGGERRRAVADSTAGYLHEFERTPIEQILVELDKHRPCTPKLALAAQTHKMADVKKMFGRRLYDLSLDFRRLQVLGLTDWLESYRNIDNCIVYCCALFAHWARMRVIVCKVDDKLFVDADESKDEFDEKSGPPAVAAHDGEPDAQHDEPNSFDWEALIEQWAAPATSKNLLLKMMTLAAVLCSLQNCRVAVLVKTPVVARYEQREDHLLNLRFAGQDGACDDDETYIAHEGRGADIEHFLDRNAKVFLGACPSTPSLFGVHLLPPLTERVDKADAVMGFITLPNDWRDDQFGGGGVARGFDENVLFEKCYSAGVQPARRRFPSELTHVQTHYTAEMLVKLSTYGLYVPLISAPRGPGVSSGQTFLALRKPGGSHVRLMPVLLLSASERVSTLFTGLTSAACVTVECAALFERAMLALDDGGMKLPKGALCVDPARSQSMIAQEPVRVYRTHPLSYMKAALELARIVGGNEFSCLTRCLFAVCAIGADVSIPAFNVRTGAKLSQWRRRAQLAIESTIEGRGHLLCLCATRNKEQCNETKLAQLETSPAIYVDPSPMTGGGRFATRPNLGRKLRWTLKAVSVEAGQRDYVYLPDDSRHAYSASVFFDGGDWFNCLEVPPAVPPATIEIRNRVWYNSVGFRVYGRILDAAVDDAWDALTHLPTGRRERVSDESLQEVARVWADTFDTFKKNCYIGLRRGITDSESSECDFRSDIRELEARVVFAAGRGQARRRELPITWKTVMNMAVVSVRASGRWPC